MRLGYCIGLRRAKIPRLMHSPKQDSHLDVGNRIGRNRYYSLEVHPRFNRMVKVQFLCYNLSQYDCNCFTDKEKEKIVKV